MTADLFKYHYRLLQKQVFHLVDQGIFDAKLKAVWDDLSIVVEPPKDNKHGDMASNIALILARPLGMKPRDIAEMIKPLLDKEAHINNVTIAGPGFLNWHIDESLWQAQIIEILKLGKDYGKSDLGKGEKVNIEYVSTNPTGPLHVGHARGAVIGDALASLLDYAGYDILKEFYVNDAGAQIDKLAASVYLRYLEIVDGVTLENS